MFQNLNNFISIVILTKNIPLARTCIQSIRDSQKEGYEIILVLHNIPRENEYNFGDEVRVLHYDGDFNFSVMNNFAVQYAQGDMLLFLNDDTRVITPQWLSSLMSAMKEGVDIVGCKLLYPDNTIQHAGLIIGPSEICGRRGVANHWHKNLPNTWPGYKNMPHTTHDVSAVTGACLVIPKKIFEDIGGFDKKLAVAFNDVDVCLKVRKLGHRIIYKHDVVLYHFESYTRGNARTKENYQRALFETEYMYSKWGTTLLSDPYLDPGLIPDQNSVFIRIRSFVFIKVFSNRRLRFIIPFVLPLLRIKAMGF